jgi:hypothetical protein
MVFRRKSREESGLAKETVERTQESTKASQGQSLPANAASPARQSPARIPQIKNDSVANDLVRRVMKAIDEWAQANGADAVPRHIIFEQALSILNAIDRNFPARD